MSTVRKKLTTWQKFFSYGFGLRTPNFRGKGVGSMRIPADKGEGVKSWQNFADLFNMDGPLIIFCIIDIFVKVLLLKCSNQRDHLVLVFKIIKLKLSNIAPINLGFIFLKFLFISSQWVLELYLSPARNRIRNRCSSFLIFLSHCLLSIILYLWNQNHNELLCSVSPIFESR